MSYNMYTWYLRLRRFEFQFPLGKPGSSTRLVCDSLQHLSNSLHLFEISFQFLSLFATSVPFISLLPFVPWTD